MYQAVIFDMDGTIIDSEPIYLASFQQAADALGFTLTKELYLSTVGNTMTKTYQMLSTAFGPSFPTSQFIATWPQSWQQYLETNGVPLKPGVLELLSFIDEIALPKAIATSSHRTEAMLYLNISQLLDSFTVIVTGDEVIQGKPAPDIYLEAAQRLGVAPENCIALEDSNTGAMAAIAAGMHTLVIPDFVQPSTFVQEHAHAILPSLHEALELIKHLLS